MRSPWFVADFDSSTALVRALAAALQGRRFRHLGRGRLPGALTSASALLPPRVLAQAFARAGAAEAIPPDRFADVSPHDFAEWVTQCYSSGLPGGGAPAVALGASDGAVMHLCAAGRIPWLPQTFLVPVRRLADPDDVDTDVRLGHRLVSQLTAAEPGVQVHQMHDANQDRLMVGRMAYFRIKLLRLLPPYRNFLRRVLAPGGTIVIVDDEIRWPVSNLGERHVFQAGAVGGLSPADYVEGSPRVATFLQEQGAYGTRWTFPPIDSTAPEAEWGYAKDLTDDVCDFAQDAGFRVVRMTVPSPGAASPYVADIFERWLETRETKTRRLLAETFICVEPTWALATGSVPYWLPFPVCGAAEALAAYLAKHAAFDDIVVTLFAHGVRSAGLAPAQCWEGLAGQARHIGELAGVDVRRWPLDFAALARYSDALDRIADAPKPVPGLDWAQLSGLAAALAPEHDVTWTTLP